MKKLFYFFSLIAALAFVAGCAKEVDVDPVKGDLVETTFTVTLDDATATKATIGNDAAKINKLLVAAFRKSDGSYLSDLNETSGNFEIGNVADVTVGEQSFKQFSVKAKLVRNFEYKIAFFAYHNGAPYTLGDDGVITMAPTADTKANDETLDAFYAAVDVKLDPADDSSMSKSVTLTRPLAQVNILSDPADWAAATASGITANALQSSVTIANAPNALNLFDGAVSGDVTLAYALNAIPGGTINVAAANATAKDAKYIAMAYVLSDATGKNFNVTFSVPAIAAVNFGGFERTVNNMPAKRNYRTNLHGDLFTVSGDFTVTIDPAWGGNDDNQDINIPQPTVSPASIPDGISIANPGIVTGASVATTGNNISLTTASSPLYFGIDSNSDGAISYASSAPTVGTITEDGVFTVVGAGDTDVTIHQMAGKTKAVNDPLSDITIIYHVHVVALEAVATPTFSPAAGAVAANTTVEIACATDGAAIYYTVDGTDPTTSSTEYTSAITIDAAKTIKAIAVKTGMANSAVATAVYTVMGVVATPTFSPAAGAVPANTTVTISCSTEGAAIHYTVDGSEPTAESATYSSAITIDAAKTIKAIAVKDGMTNSEVASAAYTIMAVVATPTFSPAAGEVAANTTVTISCSTEGAAIHYTVDGSEPTAESATYSSAITIDAAKTIKAIAVKDGMVNSAVAEAAYTIAVANPVLQSISISGQTTSFTVGDKFAFGGTVTASYDKGDPKAVTENLTYTIDGNTATPGTTDITYAMNGKNVVVSYTEADVTKSATAYAITVNKKARTVAFATASATISAGDNFTLPSLSATTGAITANDVYQITSSDEDVVAVITDDDITAELLAGDSGTATITVEVIDINNEYADASATFTVTVEETTPTPSGYSITVTQPTGATITMKNGSNQTITSGSSLDENAIVNLSVEEASGKAFVKWVVKDSDNQAVTVTNNAFTMPAKNVTVSAVIGTIVLSETFDNELTSDGTQVISTTDYPNFSGSLDKAYKGAGGTLKLGNSSNSGYITSKSLDLSTTFIVKLDARRYSETKPTSIKVTCGSVNQSSELTYTMANYIFNFAAATVNSTIKIESVKGSSGDTRAYIDNVVVITYSE